MLVFTISVLKAQLPCGGMVITFNKQNVKCFGDSTGSIDLTVVSPNAPFSYTWTIGDTTEDLNNLTVGNYVVFIRDKNGCVAPAGIAISEPVAINLTFSTTDVLCNSTATGAIDMTVIGGTMPYIYQWSNGTSTEDNNNIIAGQHTIILTDSNLCKAYDTITITEPNALTSNNVTTDVSCNSGSDGEIDLFVFGGTTPYDYVWSNGDTLKDVFGLSANTYSVTITDAKNCQLVVPIIVDEPLPISASFNVKPVSCNGASDGSIDMTVNGGTSPYTFSWSNSLVVLGTTTEDIDSLAKDKYKVKIIDAKSCLYFDSAVIDEPQVLVTNITWKNIACFGASDAWIDFSVSGGVLPYAYLWSSGQLTQDISNIPAGNYTVVVADSNGCTNEANVEVIQPDDIGFGFDVTDVSCKDDEDGIIEAFVSGGTLPYMYAWSNGSTTANIDSLAGGLYTLTITDDSACTSSATVEVSINPNGCVFIPSAFTPNRDGYNDTWIITNSELYPDMTVQVFNKWGNEIFKNTGYEEAWDGTRNGKTVAPTTYYYIIELNNGDVPFTGDVTIIIE